MNKCKVGLIGGESYPMMSTSHLYTTNEMYEGWVLSWFATIIWGQRKEHHCFKYLVLQHIYAGCK
jgi:hypothetical protein